MNQDLKFILLFIAFMTLFLLSISVVGTIDTNQNQNKSVECIKVGGNWDVENNVCVRSK